MLTWSGAKERIENVDWNFRTSSRYNDVHAIHPFPAKFIPQIPRQVISLLNISNGSTILDPFVGSGTTILEARLAGVNSVGIDINPIAVLISKVKTSILPRDAVKIATQLSENAREKYLAGVRISVPDIPRLQHWFSEENARALACLTECLSDLKTKPETLNYLRLCLSLVILKASNQESDTRYATIEPEITGEDIFDSYKTTALSVANKLINQRAMLNHKLGKCTIYCHDSRKISELRLPKISLVITSPPYPNAYEYWLYNKYRMYWLGFDPIAVREKEIGARPHYSKPNGKSIDDYTSDLVQCFEGVKTHLVPNAHIFIVVGTFCKIRGTIFNTAKILQKSLNEIGYSTVAEATRSIPSNRKTFNPVIGSTESETLMLFRWGGGNGHPSS